MKCRKAFELDLADFVVDPSADAWAAFRAHYPGCADCAAEVAVWDEMQAFLRSGGPGATTAHPPKELLLRYEEQRATLSALEAATLGKHLATCRTCPDELAALRTFDFSVLRRQPVPKPWWTHVRGMLARIRPVVLHPVFAYALPLILLSPVLIRLRLAQIELASLPPATSEHQRIVAKADLPEVASPPPAEERIAAPTDGLAIPREAPPLREEDPDKRTVPSEATQRNSQLAAANTRPPRVASRRMQPARSAGEDRAPTNRALDDAPAADAPTVTEHAEDASDERAAIEGSDTLVNAESEDAGSDVPRVLGLADTEEPRDDARQARRAAKGAGAVRDDAGDASWQTIVLAPGRTPAVQRTDLTTGVVLRVPPTDRDVEIRIVGPDGREAARETVRASSEPAEIRLRATGFVAGTYRVFTRRLNGSASSEETSELAFIVR